jgi:tRNA dimethylallyltransferase
MAIKILSLIEIDPSRPVLIAGPTASGKSALALRIAREQGGVVVNADALQVFDAWPILSAQPDHSDTMTTPHKLYGHVPHDGSYSVGTWLRQVADILAMRDRPIIVGGTGLYFTALTEGLAEIPATPPEVRQAADAMSLNNLLQNIDTEIKSRIDTCNRARVQRAWEVAQTTGRSLASWQDTTPPPLLPCSAAVCLLLDAPKGWLTPRIARRFDSMLDRGLLAEARAQHPLWNPAHQSSRAIGAAELIAHLDGEMTLQAAREAIIIASRQYAKRQRTWFRKRMTTWQSIPADQADVADTVRLLPRISDCS